MPGKAGVEYTLSGDSAEVVNALKKIAEQVDRTEKRLEKVGRTGKQGAEDQSRAYGKLTSDLGRYAAGLVSVQTAIGLIRAEWQNVINTQKQAAQTNVQFGDAIAQTVRNLGGQLGSAAQVEQRVAKVSGEINADPKLLAQVVSGTASAIGVQNKADAERAVQLARAAVQAAPELDAAQATQLAVGAASVRLGENATPQERVGTVLQLGQQSFVRDLGNLTTNITPAVGNLEARGLTTSEAGSLLGAITQGSKDVTGATSATAATQLVTQLQDQLGAGNFAEQIGSLQQDERLRRRFLSKASFDVKSRGAIERLLTAGTTEAGKFTAGIEGFGTKDDAGRLFESQVADLLTSQAFQQAQLERGFTAATTSLQIGNVSGARKAISREGLAGVLKAGGFSNVDQQIDALGFEFTSGGAPVKDVVGRLRRRAENVLNPEADPFFGIGGTRAPTADEQTRGDSLNRVADKLERLLAKFDQPQKVEVVNDVRPVNTPRAPAAAALGN